MKILITDIDSSMNFNDSSLVNIINKFVSNGNKFIIATNKSINYVADILALTDLDVDYYICNDGAVIFDRYFNVVYRKDISENVVRPILGMLEDDNNIIESFVDTSHGFVKYIDRCANGIVAQTFDSVKAEMLLNQITLKYPSIHGYIKDNWMNIIDIDVNKCSALDYLKDNYRLVAEEICILGKNKDDLELVEKYSGYAQKDCCEDIKKYVKGTVENLEEIINLLSKNDEEDDDIIDTIY